MSECIHRTCYYRTDTIDTGCKKFEFIDVCSQLVLFEDLDAYTLREENKIIRIKMRKLIHIITVLVRDNNDIDIDVILEFLKDEE